MVAVIVTSSSPRAWEHTVKREAGLFHRPLAHMGPVSIRLMRILPRVLKHCWLIRQVSMAVEIFLPVSVNIFRHISRKARGIGHNLLAAI